MQQLKNMIYKNYTLSQKLFFEQHASDHNLKQV